MRIFTAAAVALLAFVASVNGEVAAPSAASSHLFQAAAFPQGQLSNVKAANSWVLYKQCGEAWSNDELGTAQGTTVSA
jgi:hypothetical protein